MTRLIRLIQLIACIVVTLTANHLFAMEDSMLFRLRIEPLNTTSGLIEPLGFTNGLGHLGDDGLEYFPGLQTSFNMERRIFRDGTTYGGSDISLGGIVIDNTSGLMDPYKRHGFDGRAAKVEAAPSEAGPWRVIWTGQMSYMRLDLGEAVVKLRDRQDTFARKKVQEAVYEGEAEEIEGEKKPLVYGRALNAPMTLVDANKLVYQISARPGGVVSVEKVYDSGVELGESINLLINGDFNSSASWVEEYDGIISGGKYTIDNLGLIYQTVNVSSGQYKFEITMDLIDENSDFHITFLSKKNTEKFPGTALDRVTIRGGSDPGIYSYLTAPDEGDNNLSVMFGNWAMPVEYGNWIVDAARLSPVVTDHATRAELESATIAKGGYHTCLAEGLIRLGSPPDGQVTADVVGTSPATVPEICRRLLLDQASFSAADFDDAAFAALSNANPSPAGIYLSGDETFQESLDLLMGSVGAWWGFDRQQGKMTCGRVEIPTIPDVSLVVEPQTLASDAFSREASRDEGNGIPAWRVTLRHTRNWTVQGSGELVTSATVFAGVAGVVSEARRIWLSKAYREAVAENAAIQDAHPLAPELSFDTLLLENAAAEASRRLAFYSSDLERYTLTAPMETLFDPATGMLLDVGGAVMLTCERMGLEAGKVFLVLGMVEEYDHKGDRVTLDLLGLA